MKSVQKTGSIVAWIRLHFWGLFFLPAVLLGAIHVYRGQSYEATPLFVLAVLLSGVAIFWGYTHKNPA